MTPNVSSKRELVQKNAKRHRFRDKYILRVLNFDIVCLIHFKNAEVMTVLEKFKI